MQDGKEKKLRVASCEKRLDVRFVIRRVDVLVDRRRPRLPMEQRPGDNLRSARIAAVPCRRRFLSRKERKVRKVMEGGNGANAVSVVTLCSNRAYQIDEAENDSGSRIKSAEEI